MFDRDSWQEIYETLSSNKLRTGLTAFGVSWGLLLLIIILGVSKGLENGVSREFSGRISSSVWMWSNTTSKPYAGYNKGRYFSFKNADTEAIKRQVPGVNYVSPGLQLGGWRGANNVSYKNNSGAFEINGFDPVISKIRMLRQTKGRFINDRDIAENRKVCTIGALAEKILFKGEPSLGEYIKIQGIFFQVVGVINSSRVGEEAEDDERSIFIPFSTFQSAFNRGDNVGWYALTSKPGVPASEVEESAKAVLRARHNVHPQDMRAIGSWNLEEEVKKFDNIFLGVKGLSWFVGVLTLLAGVIGISNIMLVIIKERTKEIGIRRAIGATPFNVILQIMLEALVLTTMAGMAGFISGIWILDVVSGLIEHDFFRNPEVDMNIAVTALVILACSGLLAGILPASRAVRIKPIEALRTE